MNMKHTLTGIVILAGLAVISGTASAQETENTFKWKESGDSFRVIRQYRDVKNAGLSNFTFFTGFSADLIDPNFAIENATELGIDAGRKTDLIDLVADSKAAIARVELSTSDANKTLDAELANRPVDTSQALNAFERLLDREADLKRIRLKLMIDATNLLTDEQFEAYKTLQSERRQNIEIQLRDVIAIGREDTEE